MAFAPNSISSYLATRGNCPPINGKDGVTGATGPAGTNGIDGISIGQNYYFQLPENIITSTGATGTLQTTPSNVGGNTAYTGYTGPQYSGYFIQQSQTGSNVPLVTFTSTAINQPVVPIGPWTMYNNIYSFPTPVGAQPWQVPAAGTTGSIVYATAILVDGISQTQLFQTNAIDVSDLNQEFVRFDAGIPTPIVINNPTSAYFTITYTAVQNNPGNVYEVWTQGNSFSYVTTSFAAQQGNTGPTGPYGPTGPQGPAGAPGSNGLGVQGQLAYYKNTNVIGGTPVATISSNVLTVNGNTGTVGIGEVNPAVTGLQVSRDGIYAGFIGINSTNNIFLGGGNIPQPGGNVNIQNTLNVPTLGLGSFGATNPPAQVNSGQEATIVFAGWRFSWGLTTAITGSNIPYNFITPFASAPITIINPLDGLPTFAVAGTFNRMLITTSATSRFYYIAIGQA